MSGELPFEFPCAGDRLIGIVHRPAPGPPPATGAQGIARRGVLIVVGGPQYRVGSHRQFLALARGLAAAGIPAMRFDYRGQGDSDGDYRGFEYVAPDISAAIDAFFEHQPGLAAVVLWGLCDGASAIALYAHTDPRVAAVVLVNPWVRTAAGLARAQLRHYYLDRLLDRAFWRKLGRGEWRARDSIGGLFASLRAVLAPRQSVPPDAPAPVAPNRLMPADPPAGAPALPERIESALRRFAGPILLILSGNDLVAREFEDAAVTRPWQAMRESGRIACHTLGEADHTFSRAAWRDQLTSWTRDWVLAL